MSFLVLTKCCFCVDLRAGSFIIGYLMLALRLVSLVITSVRLSTMTAVAGTMDYGYSMAEQDFAFHRMLAIITIMIDVFEILLSIALVVGLHQRLDQHLEMYYVGSFAFLVMGVIMFAVVLLRYAERFGAWAWFVIAVEIVAKLILLYFLSVIRSYYYQMKEELKDDQEQLGAKEKAKKFYARTNPTLYSNKP